MYTSLSQDQRPAWDDCRGTEVRAIGAIHYLFIATNSAPQKFRILRIMGGTNQL